MVGKSKYFEKKLSEERIYTGKVINLDLQNVELPNHETAQREIVTHHGAVGIIYIRDNKMVMVRQWRQPMEQETLEIPAGKINADESDLSEVAQRELQEETGVEASKLEKIAGFYTSPGYSNEYMTMFMVKEISGSKDNLNLDDDEFLNVEYLTLKQAKQEINTGLICDSKTIYAINYWELLLERNKNNDK